MILAIINIFILHEFILKVIILIIMAECYIYTTLLSFTAHSGNMAIFIVIKALDNSTFFMK